MKINDWVDCHIQAYRYFGGVTRLLIPDNLKVGIIQNKKYEDPILNKSYQEMADYYDTTIIPTRVRKPKDKAAVEGAVGDCTVAIVGKLRNRKFFSFEDLNKAIIKELDNFNNRPFQKKEGSRKSVYLDEELPFMKALTEQPFELSVWKRAKVQLNYHISIEKMNYSVPYEYVGNYVDVKVTKRTVTVYYKMNQICTHDRLYGRINQYSTNESHMPENHQKFQWNKDRFMKWAASIGDNTSILVSKLFDRYKVEEQAYKGCMSLLKLSDKYGKTRLENACQLALDHISQPGYKNIKMILQSNQDLKDKNDNVQSECDMHAFVRGKDYYGGKNNG
ncbi:MAG: transposase [Holdemanella biformis]|nr:transposase [Holdemanella biformis]